MLERVGVNPYEDDEYEDVVYEFVKVMQLCVYVNEHSVWVFSGCANGGNYIHSVWGNETVHVTTLQPFVIHHHKHNNNNNNNNNDNDKIQQTQMQTATETYFTSHLC